jgi:hypothetical protein
MRDSHNSLNCPQRAAGHIESGQITPDGRHHNPPFAGLGTGLIRFHALMLLGIRVLRVCRGLPLTSLTYPTRWDAETANMRQEMLGKA